MTAESSHLGRGRLEGSRHGSTSADDCREFLSAHYPLILQVVRRIAQRRRLSHDEAEELRSVVHLKLVDRSYAVLGSFRGQSELSTYLLRVVDRICLDIRTAQFGRFRPSVEARKLGETAVRLERLLRRERMPFDQACEVLRQNYGVSGSESEFDRVRRQLPVRKARPVLCSLEAAEWHVGGAFPSPDFGDEERQQRLLRRRIGLALHRLPHADRRLLALRFRDGWTVARIARSMRTDQKALYRQYSRIYAALRAAAAEDLGEKAFRDGPAPEPPDRCPLPC